jgi:carbon-monoxide dehydrogenase medium subunit
VKPAPFEYRRPATLDEALDLLAEHGDECKPLAGGQSLLPLLAMRLARPAILADLQAIEELRRRDATFIGAMVTNAELEEAGDAPGLVRTALPHIGHPQIRSRGTVGGSLAHADPAAEWPALALALDGRIVATSKARGEREIAADDFFTGPLTSSLAPDELVLGLRLPEWAAAAPHGFAEVARRPGDFALAGAAAAKPRGASPRVALFAVGSRPQLVDAEDPQFETTGDVHASAPYRKEVGRKLVATAVAALTA